MIADINPVLRGWAGYFGFGERPRTGELGRVVIEPIEELRQIDVDMLVPQVSHGRIDCSQAKAAGEAQAEHRDGVRGRRRPSDETVQVNP